MSAAGEEYEDDGCVSFTHRESKEVDLRSEACWEMSCRSADAMSPWRSSGCTDGAAGVAGSQVSTGVRARGFSLKRVESETTNDNSELTLGVCVCVCSPQCCESVIRGDREVSAAPHQQMETERFSLRQ